MISQIGQYIIDHARTEDVIMHDNNHIQASGAVAGRPSLLGYTGTIPGATNDSDKPSRPSCLTLKCVGSVFRDGIVVFPGWMWTHGYDYHHRDKDRNFAIAHINDKSSKQAETALYNWGVKYVVVAGDAAPAPLNATFLDGHVKRVFQAGRFHLYKVKHGDSF